MYRTIEYYKNYFSDFFCSQSENVKRKFVWTLSLIENVERVPEEYLKHLRDGMYEIRVQFGREIYRVFCFFDKGKLVIAINGFQKKTQKTPEQEIELAFKIRNDYETEKQLNAGK